MHRLDDSSRGGRDLAEGVDVRHDVVAALLLLRGGDLKLCGVQMLPPRCVSIRMRTCDAAREQDTRTHQVRLHLLYGLVRYREAELLLCNREVEPELPPRVEAVLRGNEPRRACTGRRRGRTAEEKRWAISLLA